MSADPARTRSGSRALPIVAVLVIALLGGLAWLYWSGGEHASASATAARVDADGERDASSTADAAAADESTRTALETKAEVAPAESSAAPVAASRVGELRGRVIDSNGAPVAGARVALQRGEARDFSVLDMGISKATMLVAEVASDAQGEFRFPLERGVPVDLAVEAPGFCKALLADRHAGEFVEIALSAGFLAFGRVTRARDGAPVADAKVSVFKMGGPSSLACEAETAADGRYEIRFTFREGVTLSVVPKLEQASDWIELELGPDGSVEKNVELADGIVVTGKVTEMATQRPIVGAIVGEGWWYQRTAETDAQGEYRLPGFGNSGIVELACKATGFGQTKMENLPGAVDGVMHVDFELAPARRARGRVVDGAGAPLEGVLAAAVASEFGEQGQRVEWLFAHTDADGRFRIENLTLDLNHALMLTKHGFASRVYDFPTTEITQPEIDLGTFELGLPALLAGIVEDENAHGLGDVEVILNGNNSDRFRLRGDASQQNRSDGDFYTKSRSTRTDAAGRFSFGDVGGGDYSLQARQRRRPESPKLQLSVSEGEIRDDLKILLATGASLRGRVVDPQKRVIAGVQISATVIALRDATASDYSRAYARTGADGKFEFKGLGAGDYRIEAEPRDAEDTERDSPLLRAVVERATTDSGEIEVVMPRGAPIRGKLVDATGAALFGYTVLGKGPDKASVFTTTNAAGEFALAVANGSVWELEVHGAMQTDAWRRIFVTQTGVVAGTRDLVLEAP